MLEIKNKLSNCNSNIKLFISTSSEIISTLKAHSPVLIMHGHRKSPFSHPSPLNRGAQNNLKKF